MPDLHDFHDVLFPLPIAFGATGGPERRNEIVQMTSGKEQRNARFQASRRRYDAGTGVRSVEDLYQLVAFFEARRGSLHGFRFRDPFDRKSGSPENPLAATDQQVATGDGSTSEFVLAKTYGTGTDAYRRVITKPVAGTVRVAVDGFEKTAGTEFAVDATSGTVIFAGGHVPAPGATITAGFEFDVPVRFDLDHLSVSLTAFQAGQIPTIPLVEIPV